MSENLNEVFTVDFADASVITVPIDDTLSNSGEAADAKAVGDALALKADLADIANIKVNEQAADNQGQIILSGEDVPMSDLDDTTLTDAIEAAAGRTAADIPMASNDATTVATKISAVETSANRTGADIPLTDALGAPKISDAIEALNGAVKSVNGDTPDTNGNVSVQRVNLAGNLETSFKASSESTFLQRTSGGAAAVVDGESNLICVMGNSVKTGYVAEVIAMDVQPADAGSDLSATINKATWRDYVTESGTITFTYATSGTTWKVNGSAVDLDDYGITVTGTPANNDSIVVSYVAEERGTIANAFDNDDASKRFVATGWNLYRSGDGYAKVVRYSNEYGYRIDGAYTAIQFAATYGGQRSAITPNASGIFNVPADGYVFVTGGNGTTTAIYPTWGDWVNGTPNEFQTFNITSIDLSTVIANYFENGMFCVGDTRDEINLANGQAISRIERMAYSAENLAAAVASGRAYDYDEDYIYLVRTAAGISSNTHSITISGVFTVSDHGIEYFEGSDVPVYAKSTYGMNLKNKLERDTVTISQQTLSDTEKRQVRENIGASDVTLLDHMFKIVEYHYTIASIAANKALDISADSLGISTPAGYEPVGLVTFFSGSANLTAYLANAFATGNSSAMRVRNLSGSALSGNVVVMSILYVKTGFNLI